MWELNEFTEETAYYIREIPPATDMGNTSHPITLVFRILNFNLEMSTNQKEILLGSRIQTGFHSVYASELVFSRSTKSIFTTYL